MEEKVFEILEDICEEDLRETPDVNIFEEGLMDSLGLVRFIVEVEEQLGITLGIMELDKEVVNTPNKIIEFFSEEGKGQLIFTTHNTTLLNTLRKYNNSIDFINENKEIIPWIKNGNSSVFNKYREGYIKGLPFNIVESDFYEIFSNEEGV